MIDDILTRNERIREPISTNELERRWKEVRAAMRKNALDVLVIENAYRYPGGYLRWFTDFPGGYSNTLLFPVEGEMTLISSGGLPPTPPGPPAWVVRGVKERLNAPYFALAYYTDDKAGEMAVQCIKSKRPSIIGVLGMQLMSAATYENLRKGLSDVKIVNASDLVDQIRAIKSEEEIKMIQKTAAVQDIGMEVAIKAIRPNRREIEIYNEVQHALRDLGSEQQFALSCGSGPAGSRIKRSGPFLLNRMLREGDQFSMMIEASGPGGYWTEIARDICMHKVPKEFEEAWNDVKEAQKITADMLRPGANPADLWDANNEFLKSKGYPLETRLYSHGQGYDLVERPLIKPEEPMKIMAGMNITVHPTVQSEKAYACVMDNWIVTETGVSKRLHKTPQEVFVV